MTTDERSGDIQEYSREQSAGQGGQSMGAKRRIVRMRQRTGQLKFSRLTLTIVMTNLISLILLFFGALTLNQYRDGLIESKLEGGRAQAQIIADIMAQVAIDEDSCTLYEVDTAQIDDDTLPLLDANRSLNTIATNGDNQLCRLSLVPGDVKEVFNRVWDSFEGRVRIFNAPDGRSEPPVTDAAKLLLEDVMLREDRILEVELPSIEQLDTAKNISPLTNWRDSILSFLFSNNYRSQAARVSIEDELNEALQASPFALERGAAKVRVDENGELVASVSVPIRKVQAIYGIVTAEIGGIDDLVQEARLAILPLFGMACAATVLTALMLTAIIAQPIRQLATAADKVREGISAAGRARIPDFSTRRDEIGELSISLKSMTQSIYDRIEAIESFAADVSHELKNPLTSIRSATETLDIAKTPEARDKLMGVIKKDVERMDRLITDISNASRLDAELAREGRDAIPFNQLIADIVSLYSTTAKEGDPPVSFKGDNNDGYILGNPSALGQVFRNLIDNAKSFSPEDGAVRVKATLDETNRLFRVLVEDDGPGIPPDMMDAIFNRFYTKRPKGAAFGNNSGLGLAISRQIVHSHGGRIWAENRIADPARYNPEADQTKIAGARFVVELPVA